MNVFLDEDGDWLAHFMELPNVSAFGPTPERALKELDAAWALVKESYAEEGKPLPVAPRVGSSAASSRYGLIEARPSETSNRGGALGGYAECARCAEARPRRERRLS